MRKSAHAWKILGPGIAIINEMRVQLFYSGSEMCFHSTQHLSVQGAKHKHISNPGLGAMLKTLRC